MEAISIVRSEGLTSVSFREHIDSILLYSSANMSEAVAEAHADVFSNGDEALAISKAVVAVTKRRVEEIHG